MTTEEIKDSGNQNNKSRASPEVNLLLLLLLSHFSRVQLCATPWTAAYQASIHGILQARTLEWVAISFSISKAKEL